MGKANENKEVGTIGQMYENRKTKQFGVLESRDDKYKTLMFRDKDGKSFNVTYATFHSAWRKYAGSEIIETSTQKEEKKSQKKDEVAKAEKVVQKDLTEKPKIDNKTKVETVKALKTLMEKIIQDKGYKFEIKTSYKGGLKIKHKRKNILEVWSRFAENRISVCMTDELAEMIDVSDAVEVINGRELGRKWDLNIKFRFDKAMFEDMITVVLDALYELIGNDVEDEESSEEE